MHPTHPIQSHFFLAFRPVYTETFYSNVLGQSVAVCGKEDHHVLEQEVIQPQLHCTEKGHLTIAESQVIKLSVCKNIRFRRSPPSALSYAVGAISRRR